jgi:hypothetical protein
LIIVRTERWLAAAAIIGGIVAWAVYFERDLVLSHYDAKAHLVVARRVIDSLTPGWQQFGAVWLPLPHLLQVLPTQIDWLYQTGLFGSLLSIAALAVSVWAAARLVLRLTGSALGAAAAGLLLLLNPNLLYLHSTPMTEPLLLAATLVSVLWTCEWLSAAPDTAAPAKLGWALFATMWTRYEAWPVVAVLLAIVGYVLWVKKPGFLAPVARLALWPAAAVILFVLNSRITVGSWFVTGGFYERDPLYDGQLWRSLVAVWWGTYRLSGFGVETVALIALAAAAVRAVTRRELTERLVPVALFAAGALPMYAFHAGHPFRVRYMVPTTVACAVFSGIAVGLLQRPVTRRLLAALLIGSSLLESSMTGDPPLVEEAQWDVPRSRERRAVTECLAPDYHGEKIMASMGSLAHYMQELSREGFAIADFVHEGNGVIWQLAVETGPAAHVGWMLIEEQSEGGDVLAQRLRADPAFARGMTRICEGGGVALYRRDANPPHAPDTEGSI